MPPKTKKNSKTLSRLSNADESALSPRTPSLASAADSEASEQEYILLSLEEASKSSMVSSSLAPGSIESVDEIANEAGNYFALEMVFPSCEGLALFQTKQAAEYTCSKKKQIYSRVQGIVARKWHPLLAFLIICLQTDSSRLNLKSVVWNYKMLCFSEPQFAVTSIPRLLNDGYAFKATLLNLMDGISRTDGTLDSIDPALRRPRRHGRETEIGNTNRLPGKLKLWDTLVCLKRYARSKKSDYSSHSKGSSIAYEGCSDSVVRECDCSTGVGDMLRYSADSAFSNTSYLRVSSENPPSSCCNGTVSEIEDKIENGIIACPEEELMVEEESC
ncbi:hypothetical protein POTOM_051301 [Populus tomentosa]|uniref:Uncharacterized protein n=1 Tax=Populus tomentosa TaxID=118781 RepID=A0A8X8C6T5_POPTO|nr:hypothetical protein POTOM_051301 [Populus tomentosa]